MSTTTNVNAKAALRAEVNEATQAYLQSGKEIHSGDKPLGISGKDWSRLIRGQKVATLEEITAERDRRALIAIRNKDIPLVTGILTGRYDREIKFDIENDRLGPNGEIR